MQNSDNFRWALQLATDTGFRRTAGIRPRLSHNPEVATIISHWSLCAIDPAHDTNIELHVHRPRRSAGFIVEFLTDGWPRV